MIRSPAGFDGGDRIKRYLDYYQPSYGVMMLSAGQFSPASLFAAGEQGAWYDPSDFSTMFQDSAGTTPVTAVEQPVGLLLDKSKGLALGSNLATDSNAIETDVNATTGWTPVSVDSFDVQTAVTNNSIYAFQVNSETTKVAAARIYRSMPALVTGKSYALSIDARHVGIGGAWTIAIAASNSGTDITVATLSSTNTTWVSYKCVFTASASTAFIVAREASPANDGGLYLDNLTIRELPGNHASQSTSASRPVLSARVNLLTYSEQFDNAAWLKFAVAVPATKYADPYGGTTANLLYPTAATTDASLYRGGFATVGKTHSYAVKAAGKSWFCILKEGTSGGAAWFNLSTGLVGTVAAGYAASNPVSLGNGWYRCTVTSTSGFNQYTAISAVDADNSTTPTPNGTDGVYIWGADVRVTNDGVGIPAYQRIAAATDYDTSGFPLYLKFDGTDDTLLGSAVSDFISASAYEACVGARFNAVTTNNVNSWLNQSLVADSAGYVGIGMARSTGVVGAFNFDATQDEITVAMTPPATIVLQQRHSGGNLTVSTNQGAEVSTASGNTAALTGVLQLLKAFGSVFTNGRLYGVIIRNTAFTTAERANVLTWMNGKTKAY